MGGAPRPRGARALHAREPRLLRAPRRRGRGQLRERARRRDEARRRRPPRVRRDRDDAGRPGHTGAGRRRPPWPPREGGARLLRLELADRQAEASLDRQRQEEVVDRAPAVASRHRPAHGQSRAPRYIARSHSADRRSFFDGPGGTQCPDEVIDAISRYLREDNANIGAPYETSAAPWSSSTGRTRRRRGSSAARRARRPSVRA